MPQDDLINKLAGYFLGTKAVDRFTRTPISYNKKYGVPSTQATRGEYKSSWGPFSPKGSIDVDVYDKATPEDVKRTGFHEIFHSILDKYGLNPKMEVGENRTDQLGIGWDDLYKTPVDRSLRESLYLADRSANRRELIPYASATNPEHIPGFTEEERNQFLKDKLPQMSMQGRKMIMRALESYEPTRTKLPSYPYPRR
jgi:hypothetical protein